MKVPLFRLRSVIWKSLWVIFNGNLVAGQLQIIINS